MQKDGALIKGRYRIIGYVGTGGQRRVYRAIDTKAEVGKRDVVLKEMFRQRSYQHEMVATSLMQQEIRILIDYPHPSIPRIHDVFSESGKYYLVQDYIEGPTLKEFIAERKTVAEGEAVRLMLQVIEAVDYLHSQQPPIIIRDMKPSNVIIRHGRAFMVDLGGAQSDLAIGTESDRVALSTRGYAPPEGVKHRNAFTVDVYSVGVMLYQMLSGHDPVANPGALPSIRRLKKDIHPELERIVNRAIAYDPKNRYPSMLQFALDLERYQDAKAPGAVTMLRIGPPIVMLALILSVLGLGAAGLAGVDDLHAPLAYVALGVGAWALLMHSLWQHWLASVPVVNRISRALHRHVGKVRLMGILVGLNAALLLGVAIVGVLDLASQQPGTEVAVGTPPPEVRPTRRPSPSPVAVQPSPPVSPRPSPAVTPSPVAVTPGPPAPPGKRWSVPYARFARHAREGLKSIARGLKRPRR